MLFLETNGAALNNIKTTTTKTKSSKKTSSKTSTKTTTVK